MIPKIGMTSIISQKSWATVVEGIFEVFKHARVPKRRGINMDQKAVNQECETLKKELPTFCDTTFN